MKFPVFLWGIFLYMSGDVVSIIDMTDSVYVADHQWEIIVSRHRYSRLIHDMETEI
jgi:hypothetical protein